MTLEEMDGFFAALIAGPESVMSSEYWPEVFGGAMAETCEFKDIEEVNEILGLMTRHWNTIAEVLYHDEVYLPILYEDDNGTTPGNEWAHGFMHAVGMRPEGWSELINDEEQGGSIIPILMLHHEHHADPELRPPPIAADRRQAILEHMVAGILMIYRYFAPYRLAEREMRNLHIPARQKVGRNDPCSCGSGKKYKHCHGGSMQH
jgi:uncharacterized protein